MANNRELSQFASTVGYNGGNIGIGTDNPEDELHVFLNSSSDGPSVRFTNPNGGDGTYIGRISTGDAAGSFFAGINFLKHDTNDGEIRLRTKVAGSNTDVVTIVDGNIGVGENSPYYKFHLKTNNNATSLSGGSGGNWGSDGIRIENTNATVSSMALAHFRNYDADWHIGSRYVASDNSNFVFLAEGSEKLRIDVNGNVKIGTISDTNAVVTKCPLYIAMQTDLTTFEGGEGAATTGLLRLEETGSNNNRYHGIDLRNTNSGDIRILNQDVGVSDRGDLVIAMPDGDANDGIHNKMRFNSRQSSIQISGKGGAVAGNAAVNHTDIYLATKTGVTALNTGAGAEVAGLIRFEDTGSNNNRYHGIEIRNRNSGDIRILNLDEGTTNKANLVFGVDNGSDIAEVMRLTSDSKLLIGSDTGSVHGNRLLQIGKTDRAETYVSIVNSTSGQAGILFADTTTNDTGGYRGQIRYHHSDDTMNFRTGATERVRIGSSGQLAGLDPGGGVPQIINNANVNLGGRYIWNRISSSNNITTTTSNQFKIAFYRSTSGGYTNCYYRGVNIKIHAGGRTDWSAHGFVTYVGELLMTFSSNTSGRTHIITNEGYSFLQNNSNNMRFVETSWSYDSNYLYGTLRFNTNATGAGWAPFYNIEIIDNDGIVQSVTGL